MATKYTCTRCGKQPGESREAARKNLYTKRIEFRRYGFKGSLIRARTVAWLCKECMLSDLDYNRPEREVADRMVE